MTDRPDPPHPYWVSPSGAAPRGASEPGGPPADGSAPGASPAASPPPDEPYLGPPPLAPLAPRADRGRVGAGVWLGITALALVVGLGGGVAGSIAYQQWDDDRGAITGLVPNGLEGVQTESLAPLPLDDGSVAAVAQQMLPRTVQIVASIEGEAAAATGSGFLLDRQGHVVTNNHVVADAAQDDGPIEIVDEAGESFEATVVGRSPVYDLAVLYAPGIRGRRPVSLGRSDALRVGETVVAIGSPLGLSSTVTSGIVSALSRPVSTGETAEETSFISAVQTDAAINPGNSGGPLVNLRGQVVGVNSAIATAGGVGPGGTAGNIGVGFSIPVEQVRVTADQILRSGEARYPVIGAEVRTGGPSSDGAEITSVGDGSPAQAAGLEPEDLVVGIDGDLVTDGEALIVALRTHQPGERVELSVVREGREQDVEVVLDGRTG